MHRGVLFAAVGIIGLTVLTGCGGGGSSKIIIQAPFVTAGIVGDPNAAGGSSVVQPWQNVVSSSGTDAQAGQGNAWEDQAISFSQMNALSFSKLILHVNSATPGLHIAVVMDNGTTVIQPNGLDGFVYVPTALSGAAQDVTIPLPAFSQSGADLSKISRVIVEFGEAFNYVPTGGRKDPLNPDNTGSISIASAEFAP